MSTAVVPPPSNPEQGRPVEQVTPTPVPTGPKWYKVGIGDLVLLLLAIGIGQTASSSILLDPGVGWHLRTPDLILEQHAWPTIDTYSVSAGNQWYANQWLGDVPLWLGWKLAGLNGIVAVTLAFLLLTYRLLYGFLRADGASWPVAGLWTYGAALASYYAWMARPNLITFLAVTILARTLMLFHEGRLNAKRLWWLVPLFVVWVNSHGGFVIGLVMLGFAAALEVVPWFLHTDTTERAAAQQRFRMLTWVGLGCLAGTLVNPYGWKIYPWVFSLLGNTYFMNLHTEWLSPNFHDAGSMRFGFFIVAFPALFAISAYRPKLTAIALGALWLYLALKSSRYVPLWIMVVTPLLARACLHLTALNARIPRGEMTEFFQVRSGGWLGYGVALVALSCWAKYGTQLQPDTKFMPIEGLNKLLEQRQAGDVILNHPNFGGYLTWHGYPDVKVWLDDRNEVHGQERYEAFFDMEKTLPGWETKLAEWNPDWLVTPPKSTLAYRLEERPTEWEVVHKDELVALFKRVRPKR